MTFEEAKKILEKEGYFLTKVSSKFKFPELPVWEKQEVIEAKKIVNEHCFAIVMSGKEWFDRQERLKKEYEKNTKAPGPGEEQAKKGNPALKESASQFNDALLDEQAKKIKELAKENERQYSVCKRMIDVLDTLYNMMVSKNNKIKRLGKEISKLNSIIHDKNEVIADFGKELKVQKGLVDHISGKYNGNKINLKLRMDECENWKKKLEEKDAILADVSEELRLSKIREKNLTEVCQKYMKENEELKGKLLYVKKYRVSSDNAEEGADLSGVFVLCGKDFIDALKNVKDVWQE